MAAMKTSNRQFVPPHCPNRDCPHHRNPAGWHFSHAGYYTRKASPTRIRRFHCSTCGRWFSTQTFDTTYWLKRPRLQRDIWNRLVECVAHRQAGRGLRAVHSTIQRQAERLGRHALLFQARMAPKRLHDEDLVLDGLQTFEHSKFWPCDFNVLVGARSHYFHGFTDAELRRSGRMTAAQKRRREKLEERHGRPDPKATEKEVEALLRMVITEERLPEKKRLALRTDEHAAYPRALKRLDLPQVEHRQTSSRAARTPLNPLFAANVAELLVRHSTSAHKRETIAFVKRRQAAAERMAVFQVWRNFMKAASEKEPKGDTPAMRAKVLDRWVTLHELFHRRLFPTLIELPERLAAYYWRTVPTRVLPNLRRHQLKYAF
jgi:hypothetical protein